MPNSVGSRRARRVVTSLADWILILIAIASGCVLATTLLVVWYPYTETSNFQPGSCMVIGLSVPGNMRPCATASASVCLITSGTTTTALPVGTGWPSNVTLASSSPDPTTTETTSSVSLPVGGGLTPCRRFPCTQIYVQYAVKSNNQISAGEGLLYSDYTELQSYPGCSLSACDGSTDIDNTITIATALENWATKLNGGQVFTCYVDAVNVKVLSEIQFTSTQAFNSIFWPAVCCGLCLIALVGHMIYANTSGRRGRKTPTAATSAAGGDNEPEPQIHRSRYPTASEQMHSYHNGTNYTNDTFCGIHPANLTVDDDYFGGAFEPPPYWELMTSPNDLSSAGQRPSVDPPTYQCAVNKAFDADDGMPYELD